MISLKHRLEGGEGEGGGDPTSSCQGGIGLVCKESYKAFRLGRQSPALKCSQAIFNLNTRIWEALEARRNFSQRPQPPSMSVSGTFVKNYLSRIFP